MPAGSVSSTVVTPEVGAVPELVTLIVHVALVPARKLPVCDLLMDRFGAITVVGSVARSLVGSVSPGVLTLAEFVTDGTAAALTATFRSNAVLPPTPIPLGRIAVTTWPLALKPQP